MSSKGMIRTVLGDIPAEPWGITNAHAHLVVKADTTKPPFDSTDQAELVMTLNDSLPELQEFGDAGGFCLVELTPMGLGRDPEALVRASEETGVHVVMGTGIYHEVHHPDTIAGLDDVAIAELLVKEVTEGVGDTGIRAGIIGEQGTYTGPMTDREAVVFRASAMAAVETGVAVTTHTHLGRNALDQIDVLTSQGLDPDRIVIGHLDDGEPDLDLIREIINRGAWAQFDDIGYEYYTERLQVQMTTDVVRAGKLRQLAEEELTDHVILGSDFGMQRHLQSRGGPGLVVMAEGFWTTAIDEGVPTEVLEQCMITNAATVLAMV
jgi:predicted metal-dependent phosphotriesterase family hydrolase